MGSFRAWWMLAICGGLALAACGGSESEETPEGGEDAPQQETEQAARPALPGAAPAPSQQEQSEEPEEPAAPSERVAFDDSSASAAMETFMRRLAAGDLAGAAEICVEGSEGRAALERLSENLKRASEEGGMDSETLRSMLIGDIRGMTWDVVEEGEGVVTFEITGPASGDEPAQIEVLDMDGFWRVSPPEAGLPG